VPQNHPDAVTPVVEPDLVGQLLNDEQTPSVGKLEFARCRGIRHLFGIETLSFICHTDGDISVLYDRFHPNHLGMIEFITVDHCVLQGFTESDFELESARLGRHSRFHAVAGKEFNSLL